ncbi:MAG: condensation domain-containing protein [Ruminococcus flavefaciens]|nr:condensation domain-containing protein [Ruminococcus flavefaciens]
MNTENKRFKLTDMQMAYFIGRSHSDESGNSVRAYSELKCKKYDHERFVKAVELLMQSYEMLRCKIYSDGTQEITDNTKINIPVNFLETSEEESAEYIENRRKEIFSVEFSFDSPHLVYFEVTRFKDGGARIHIYHDGLILDGWSHEMLLGDLDKFYCGDITEPLHNSYTFQKYAENRTAMKKQEKYRLDKEYWLEQIKDFPNAPDLRSRNIPEKNTETSRQLLREITTETYSSIRKNANKLHISPFIVFLTAYGKAISKYSSEYPFLINIPISARLPEEPDSLRAGGEYSDFLIFDWNEKCNENILESAYTVQERFFELFEHRSFSGIEVVQELQRQREGTLIAPVVLTSTLDVPFCEGKELKKVYAKTRTSQVWLDSILMHTQDSILMTMDYIEEKVDTATVNKIADAFISLINEFAESPFNWEDIKSVPLTCDEEKLLLKEITPPVSDDNFGNLLYESFSADENKYAIISNTTKLTYRELRNFAGAFIDEVKKKCSNSAHMRVGILLEKGWKHPATEISCLIGNMTFVPLEIEQNEQTLLKMLNNLGVSCLATESPYIERWKNITDIPVIDVNSIKFDREYGYEIFVRKNRDAECFCIHSSGTTGLPKAIMLNEAGLVNCVIQTNREFGINSSDSCIAVTNFCHDMSVYDTVGILTAGGTVVIPEGSEFSKNPEIWFELICKHKVTVWNSSPSVIEMLLTEGEKLHQIKGQFKVVVLGGEVFTPRLAVQINDIINPKLLYNVGGPAETTIWSSWHRVTAEDMESDLIPYGHALDGLQYRVMNQLHRICPFGVEGIMYARGIGMAKGYNNNPEETAKRFIEIDGERWYNTGDCGWYLPNGEVAFGGRKDFQVEINGKRVELEGVASILNSNEKIIRCVVTTAGNAGLLTAFYTAESPLSSEELDKFARENMPRYMCPAKYQYIEEFPLTANGKTDIRKLQKFSFEEETEIIAVTENEKKLERIYRDVLGEDIILHRSIYQNGGNSLDAIKIISKIRSEFDVKIPLSDFLREPYYKDWIKLIDKLSADKPAENTVNTTDEYPLSPEQEDMWVYSSMNENTRYVLAAKLELAERPNEERLESAIKELLNEEPILRTSFAIQKDGRVRQNINQNIPEHCLQIMHLSDRRTVSEMIKMLADMPMDLSAGPLYRFILIDCPEEKSILYISLHHIISDEQSFCTVYRKILDRYYGISCNDTKSDSYFQYVRSRLNESQSYNETWENLKKAEPIEEFEIPEQVSPDISMIHNEIEFSSEALKNLREICHRENVSLFSGMLTMYAQLIYNISKRQEMWIAMPMSDRSDGQYEDTIGMFVKKVIACVHWNPEKSFAEQLQNTQTAVIEASSQLSGSFRQYVRKNRLTQKLNSVYSDIMLNLMESGNSTGHGTLEYIKEKNESNATKLQLMIDMNCEICTYHFYYDETFFYEDEMAYITEQWQNIINELI